MPYGYGYGYYFDPTYILVLIGVVISLWASAKVKTTYSKYSRVRSMSGLTGAQVADQILRANGIYDVRIEHVSGELTDHYDPKNRVLRLSDVVYNSTSVAALGVAAHECGHAVQDDKDYFPLRFRNALVPVANFGTQAAWPIIIIGLVFGSSSFLINLGILLFSLGVLFQLVTLPEKRRWVSRSPTRRIPSYPSGNWYPPRSLRTINPNWPLRWARISRAKLW